MYAIAWSDDAFDDVQRFVLLHVGHRAGIAAALRVATDLLHRNPLEAGESRVDDTDRVLIADPLTFHFVVDEAGRIVEIARVAFIA